MEIELAPLGMSLTTLGEVPRSVFRFSRVAIATILDWLIFNCIVRKLTIDKYWDSV